MGKIIGGGILLLPASVVPYGTISLVAFGVLTVGAIALALVFGHVLEVSAGHQVQSFTAAGGNRGGCGVGPAHARCLAQRTDAAGGRSRRAP
ncbi:hypothetical protein AB0P40_16880 [Streptomyces sp. NPDC079189]|uniref:hypothetical protein n=1 Tax=unclassified Streptomyces TaxID=2593676 RepID=UPI0033A363F7